VDEKQLRYKRSSQQSQECLFRRSPKCYQNLIQQAPSKKFCLSRLFLIRLSLFFLVFNRWILSSRTILISTSWTLMLIDGRIHWLNYTSEFHFLATLTMESHAIDLNWGSFRVSHYHSSILILCVFLLAKSRED